MKLINEILPFAKNHPMLTLVWVSIFITIIYLTIKIKLSKTKVINNAQAVILMNKEKAIIVDTRPNDSFRRGHITSAYNILPTDIKNGNIKSIEKCKSQPIIVVCENGMSAPTSAEILVKAGFTDVYYLKDGITGWNGQNLPLVRK